MDCLSHFNTIGTLLKSDDIRTASFVSGSFFFFVGASEINGIVDVVDDTVDGIVIDALAFVK